MPHRCHYFPAVKGDVDEQRLKDYQSRVTSWIGRQGLLFQIRYARLAGAGSILTRLVSITIGIGILGVVVLAISFGVLTVYRDSESHQEEIERQIGEALGVEQFEGKGFTRSSGQGSFQLITMEGGEKSFFSDGKLMDLTGSFALLDGVFQKWRPESLNLRRVEMRLKAGGTAEEMAAAMSGIHDSLEGRSLNRIQVGDLNCEWGYSTLTFGGIYESQMEARWVGGEWQVSLRGGYFRQNWLGPFALQKAEVRINQDGISVDALVLEEEGGTIELSGEIGGPLSVPTFDLAGRLIHWPIEELFSVENVNESRYLEGPVSGKLEVTGSTNRRIEMTGEVALVEGDELRIRDEWKLLRAISAVTRDGSYARIAFREGGFRFATGGGTLEVTEIDLLSPEVARLEGEFSTRFFDQQEAADFLDISLTNDFSEDLTDTSSAQILEDERISLERAAGEADDGFAIKLSLEEEGQSEARDQNELELQDYDGARLKNEMGKPRYEGQLRLGVPERVLAENKSVTRNYPTEQDGFLWIPIELKTVLFAEISEDAGQKLLDEGKAYRADATEAPEN